MVWRREWRMIWTSIILFLIGWLNPSDFKINIDDQSGFGVSLINAFWSHEKKKKKTKYIWFKPSDLTGWSLHLNQGSADTRSDSPGKLQIAFLEHQISGILPLTKPKGTSLGRIRYLTDPMDNIIPEPITRGAILIRINSLVRSVHNLNLEVGNHSKGRHSHSDRKICTLWSWFCFQRSFCCQIRGLGDFGISVE